MDLPQSCRRRSTECRSTAGTHRPHTLPFHQVAAQNLERAILAAVLPCEGISKQALSVLFDATLLCHFLSSCGSYRHASVSWSKNDGVCGEVVVGFELFRTLRPRTSTC